MSPCSHPITLQWCVEQTTYFFRVYGNVCEAIPTYTLLQYLVVSSMLASVQLILILLLIMLLLMNKVYYVKETVLELLNCDQEAIASMDRWEELEGLKVGA